MIANQNIWAEIAVCPTDSELVQYKLALGPRLSLSTIMTTVRSLRALGISPNQIVSSTKPRGWAYYVGGGASPTS
jgi:hypothetical protein